MPKTTRRKRGHLTPRDKRFEFARAAKLYPAAWSAATGLPPLAFAGISALAGHPDVATGSALATTIGPGLLSYAWWFRNVREAPDTERFLARRREYIGRTEGTAGRLDTAQYAGPGYMRTKQAVVRPRTYQGMTRRELRKVPLTDFAVLFAEVGRGYWGQTVWSCCEDSTLTIGPPRTNKTLAEACHGVDAPGALIVTSTKTDLAELIHPARLALGTKHWLWNPYDLGGYVSNVAWSVLVGCQDFAVATRRASALMPTDGDQKAEHWKAYGRPIFALLLHAAALGGYRARDILSWVSDSANKDVLAEIKDALRKATDGAGRARGDQIAAHWNTNNDTRTSIDSTIKPALYWTADNRIAALGDAPLDSVTFDFERLVRERETLYLMAPKKDGNPAAPLIAAMVVEIAEAATDMASKSFQGRLDPPLTMILDEAPNICPVPLDEWMASFGSRGITIHVAAQGISQLRQRWGDLGAATILNTAASFGYYGGSNAAGELRDLAELAGKARQRNHGVDEKEPDAFSIGEVLSVSEIRRLPPGYAAVYRRGLPVLVGWLPTILERPALDGKGTWRAAGTLNTPEEVDAMAEVEVAAEVDSIALPAQAEESEVG